MEQYKDWCWDHYTKTGWVFEGKRQYIGVFSADGMLIKAEIMFLSKRPAKAMKYIMDKLNNGASVESLEGITIDNEMLSS